MKPKKVDYTPRKKTKNKGTAKVSRNKKIAQDTAQKVRVIHILKRY